MTTLNDENWKSNKLANREGCQRRYRLMMRLIILLTIVFLVGCTRRKPVKYNVTKTVGTHLVKVSNASVSKPVHSLSTQDGKMSFNYSDSNIILSVGEDFCALMYIPKDFATKSKSTAGKFTNELSKNAKAFKLKPNESVSVLDGILYVNDQKKE
jgi:hypothetical protein